MFYERLHFTFVGVVATLVDSVVIAEFAGYWLHRLLHSDKFPALSRGHLIHHFLIDGPRQSMRATEYLDATDNRTSVGNAGVAWLAPSAIILLFCWGAMALLGVPPLYHVLALCTLLGWPILMFSYLLDRMHIRNFWTAIGRYGLEEMELLSLRGCSKARFHKEAGIKTASRNT
jgi:sterol desaturase/sphingolipid hydroxylase (fatty acid hydroxylase superfamily)